MPPDALHTEPLVIFVGAGASAVAPSSLPGWIDFNSVLLESLGEQVAAYSRRRQPVDVMLTALKARRDQTAFLPPDFQAQLMEEEVGAEYFRVWQSIDTDVFGPVHAGIAELAATGRVAAIITTNFDRLIEVALQARGVAFTVHHDAAAFDRLATAGVASACIPVLKIHGSIEDAASLVDTLRQRLTGRPASLQAALRALLVQHHWLFLGFSGADFSYDPNYLGILDAADDARGFTFLAREGSPVQQGVTALVARYGDKATLIMGDLCTWLSDSFALPALALPNAGGRTPELARSMVRDRIDAWTASLGPIAVVNILCALLRTVTMDDHAYWLLRKTWRSYRSGSDTRGSSYARYTYNYGLSLMEHGFIGNPVVRAADCSNLAEWKDAADHDATQFFQRSYDMGALHVAGAQLAACEAYMGHVDTALGIASRVTDGVIASGESLAYVDVALACVPIYDMIGAFQQTVSQLQSCASTAQRLGDEPRRALALVHLARFLCMTGQFDLSAAALDEAQRIADRLALSPVQLLCRSARGRLLLDSEQGDDAALTLLQGVVNELHAHAATPLYTHVDMAHPDFTRTDITGVPPLLCRALLDLNRAARFAGDAHVMKATLLQLHELTSTRFPGYAAHATVAHAQCLLHHGDATAFDRIAACIDDVRAMQEETGNPWAGMMAEQLCAQLAEAQAAAHG